MVSLHLQKSANTELLSYAQAPPTSSVLVALVSGMGLPTVHIHRVTGFDTRSRGLKPWMIALLIVLLLTVVAVAIGLLVHFLVSDEKMEYYHATFKISDLRVNRNSGPNSQYQFMELREISENLILPVLFFYHLPSQTPELFIDGMDAGAGYSSQRVDETFIDSALNKHYIKNQVVKLTPEEDGTTVDIIMVFQFPSAEPSAVRSRKIRSILDEKIRNTRVLPINTSSVEVNAMSSSTGKLTVQACCGKRAVPLVSNRIMSGEIAGKAAWPWQASLQYNNIHQCGATLISNTWLVTAAHCFKNKANPHQWTVSFGTKINPPLMKRNIRRITVHERYHFPARENDIAVVQFSPRVTFTDDIRRICLPEASASFQPNSTVYITGFGALFYGGESQNDLREARLKIISDDVCKQPHVYGSDIKFGMMCAGYLEGIYDACRGDSGGPLVGKDLKDTWYLIGIVSWGDNCGQRNKPGVYTKVTYYRNWITSKTGL
ncbi:transmembrane protease serine 11A [Dama dama]